MTLVDQIRDLISEGQTEKSLEELYKFVKENNADIIDNLVMLRNRMQNVERAVNVGTMSSQEASLEKAKINDAILKLLPQLTPEYLAEASKRKASAPSSFTSARPIAPAQNNSKLYMLIGGLGGALLLLVLLIVWANGYEDETDGTQTENQEMLDGTAPALDGHEQAAATMLAIRLAANGTATWEATHNRLDDLGSSSFVFDNNTSCYESAYGTTLGTWQIVEDGADYVLLYDPESKEYMRLNQTTAEVRKGENGPWKTYYDGAWK